MDPQRLIVRSFDSTVYSPSSGSLQPNIHQPKLRFTRSRSSPPDQKTITKMPRPRALSLSPTHSRPLTFLTDSFVPSRLTPLSTPNIPISSPPTSLQPLASQMQKKRSSRYSPYISSRLSMSSTPFSSSGSVSGSEVDTASSSEGESTSQDNCRVARNQIPTDPSAPISTRLSLLGLDRPSSTPRNNVFSFTKPPPRSKASIRFAHRRTQSLSIPTSYGYIILPQKTPTKPTFAPHLSPITSSPPSTDSDQVSTTPSLDIRSLPSEGSIRRTSFDRMMLVNPAIAAHLKKGGVVAMRTPDGMRRWRIRLPRKTGGEGLGLQGITKVTERVGSVLV